MKTHKKWIMIGCIALLALLSAAGVYRYQQKESSAAYSLIYIPKTEDGTNDFWTSLIEGTRMAAKEYNVSLELLAPSREQDVERQIELLGEAIEKKPDAILISPSTFDGADALLEEAKNRGIVITFIDSFTGTDIQDLTVATDNLEVGRELGEYAAKLIDENAQIAIVSHVKGVSTAMEREQGFKDGLGSYEKNVVDTVYCDSLFDKAYELTVELMEKYPNLQMIAGMNEYSSVGAARAVRDAGAQDRIKIVGVDTSQEAVQLLEQGVFQCLVVQKAFKMGYVGVRETVNLLNGKKVERDIDSGCELVTPQNMYDSEIEKLIFPFYTTKQENERNNTK